jgi:NADH-quinone oxidoreductase subunit M
MLAKAPYLASILTFAAVASLGLPGLAGFWGEMLALLGAYRPDAGLPRETFVTFMAVGGLGAVLTAAYFLRMLARVTHGAVADRWRGARLADVRVHELLAWTPLITATLFIGMWPKTLLALTDGAVRGLLGLR